MTLFVRNTELTELMDDPECDRVRLRRTLRRFGTVNRFVSGWGRVYDTHIRPVLASSSEPKRMLDVGCGSGDVLRGLVRRAHDDGFQLFGVGIDPDPRALAVAHESNPNPRIEYRQAYSRDLIQTGDTFDIVISNHLLHHLSPVDFTGLIDDSETLARRLTLHSDIARSHLAYGAYALGITPLAPGTFLRVDGLRSIRRSYTRDELAAQLPAHWAAVHSAPLRVLAIHHQGSNPS